jgi:hypothetical protein
MLMSETNNIGVRNDTLLWDALLGGKQKQFDYKALGSRKAVENWNNTIFSYIKNELLHNQHLLGTGYTGLNDITKSDANGQFDLTFESNLLDVVSYSSYSCESERWQKWSEFSQNEPSDLEFDWARLAGVWNKIIVHSEQGQGIDLRNDIDWSQSVRDNWFSGVCYFSSGGSTGEGNTIPQSGVLFGVY